MKHSTKKLVMSALFAAIVCVLTVTVRVPSPLGGYLNLGDCAVLLCGWLLSPWLGFLAAGLGSALADVASGYLIYAPATLLIKGVMALTVYAIFRILSKRIKPFPARLLGGLLAELWMVLGYWVFEGFLYGFLPSAVNIPANGVQGVAGLMLGVALIKVFERLKISFE
jgi:uncharacterized membrane protein